MILDNSVSFPNNGRLRVESSGSNSIEPDPCEEFETDLGYWYGTSPDYNSYEKIVALLELSNLETIGRTRRARNLRIVCSTETIAGCPERMIRDSDGLCVSIYLETEN